MTSGETYYNSPGSVEDYLAWAGGLQSGSRGEPPSNTAPGSIQIEGEAEVMQTLARYGVEVPEMAFSELQEWAEKIFQESQKQVPWETTHLMQTGTVEPGKEDNTIEIGYGGEDAPYAARQHEDMTLHHPKPGTKAKYLEDPANEIAPQIAPGIVAKIDSYFGGVGI